MTHILSILLSYVLIYKYYSIFIITFLGAIALPLPSGSVVMAAAAFSIQGYLNFYLVVLCGVAGNMAGDSAGYWLVRLYGMEAVSKVGLKKFFPEEKLRLARQQIEDHCILTIYLSRFLTAIAPAVNIICGFTKLSYKKFLLFEALGEVTEVTCFAVIGYIFGSNWEYFNQLSNKFWIVIVAGSLFSVVLWRLILKKRKPGLVIHS